MMHYSVDTEFTMLRSATDARGVCCTWYTLKWALREHPGSFRVEIFATD